MKTYDTKLFEPTIKQYIALMRWGNSYGEGSWWKMGTCSRWEWDPVYDTTTEVLGYGAAGWGKSVLISRFLKECVEKYPGTRWFWLGTSWRG